MGRTHDDKLLCSFDWVNRKFACGLLTEEGNEPAALKKAFALISETCAADSRHDFTLLRAWAEQHFLPFVPRAAQPVQQKNKSGPI